MRSKEVVARELEAVRRRSLDLLEPVPEPDQVRQHSPLMSPLVWDLAHVGNYEEQWLLRAVAGEPGPPAAAVGPDDVLVEGGPFVMGTDLEPWAYDNERPAHEVDLAPFRIDVVPVTNRAYLAFVDDGGYDDRRVWAEAGWAWR